MHRVRNTHSYGIIHGKKGLHYLVIALFFTFLPAKYRF